MAFLWADVPTAARHFVFSQRKVVRISDSWMLFKTELTQFLPYPPPSLELPLFPSPPSSFLFSSFPLHLIRPSDYLFYSCALNQIKFINCGLESFGLLLPRVPEPVRSLAFPVLLHSPFLLMFEDISSLPAPKHVLYIPFYRFSFCFDIVNLSSPRDAIAVLDHLDVSKAAVVGWQ